ncbi:YjbE family putative metal transport protein [Effusibacillus lacus]|uniref:Membrane protein n=1 Tax=Effusibacillus lacus TaxID=1348429 RepID=A0A292YM65_9BACL|nr:YjbE family putative metal transport protein [Effusibacillus lacus]GAX91018.1 membrane protein [Effusibacillus lacus]
MDGFWLSLGEIVLVNLVLSGDNALLIAMATSGLPRRQRRFAMLFGITGALLIRLVLTGVAVEVMAVPYVKAFGALLLAVIAVKLVGFEDEPAFITGGATLLSAAGTILLADLTMSLDNVAAIAGMAAGDMLLLSVGLIISMAFMMVASVWISSVLDRFPQLMLIGAGILAWTAGRILAEDSGLSHLTGKYVWTVLALFVLAPILFTVKRFRSRQKGNR